MGESAYREKKKIIKYANQSLQSFFPYLVWGGCGSKKQRKNTFIAVEMLKNVEALRHLKHCVSLTNFYFGLNIRILQKRKK